MRFVCLILLSLSATFLAAQVVCIDPGHPSEVGMGTQGKKLTEIHAAWVEANLLKSLLEKHGVRVVMTKNREGERVSNRRRAEIANRAKAHLMIRLHCDAASGSGFTNYYPAQPGKVGSVSGPSKWVIAESRRKATAFHLVMAKALSGRLKNNGLRGDRATHIGAKQGALTGSIFSHVPVLLCEMVVLTNPKDEAFLTSRAGRNQMAQALYKGVLAALKKG